MTEAQITDRLLLDEYEIQHFEFSSTYFIEEFKNSIKYKIKSIHEEMEECLIRKLELSDEKKELQAEIATLTEAYIDETDKCLAKHEESIRNIFSIPPYVLTNNDKIHEEYANVNEQELLNVINDLKRQYLKEQCLTILYEEEIKHIDRTSQLQSQVSKLLKQIDKIPDSNTNITQFNKLYNLYKDLLHRFEDDYVNLRRKQELNFIMGRQ